MARARGNRSKARLADLSIQPEPVDWRPPPEECISNVYHVYVTDSDRVTNRMETHRGDLVDFAITQCHQPDGSEWQDVARVDCCHNEVHRHLYRDGGTEINRVVFREVSAQTDIEVGYDWGDRLINEQWEENVRRWASGE